MDIDLSKIDLKKGMTKDAATKSNALQESLLISTIFDVADKDGNGTLDEKEIERFGKLKSEMTRNHAIANPKMEPKISKINVGVNQSFKKISSLESSIRELEIIRNTYENELKKYISDNTTTPDKTAKKEFNIDILSKAQKSEYKKLNKNIKDVNSQIEKLQSERKTQLEVFNKLSAELLYLEEVKIDDNMSNKDISVNSQNYAKERNQLNPYYAKYMDITAKYNTEKDPVKRQKLFSQWQILNTLVSNWKPKNTKKQNSNDNTQLNVELNEKIYTDNNISSATLSGKKKIKNNTISVGSSYTDQDDDKTNSYSTNVSTSVGDNIEIGEKSNLSINSNYTNYKLNSNSTITSTNGLTTTVGVNSQIDKFALTGNYSNTYSHSNIATPIGSTSGKTITNAGSASVSYNPKDFKLNIGTNIQNTRTNNSSQTLYSFPLETEVNFGNDNNQFSLNGSYTPTLGKNYNSLAYATGLTYNYNNSEISLENSMDFGYTKDKQSGNSLNYGDNLTLTNKKYGYSASLNFENANSNFNNTYNGAAKFTTPITPSSKLSVSAGYDSTSGGYGMVGVAFNFEDKNHKTK